MEDPRPSIETQDLQGSTTATNYLFSLCIGQLHQDQACPDKDLKSGLGRSQDPQP